jgi:cell division protein FtsL
MNSYLQKGEYQPSKNRTGWLITAIALAFFAVLFCYVWQKIYLTRQVASIEYCLEANRRISDRVKMLTVEKQRLSFSGRLEQAALENLGMSYPEKGQLVGIILSPKGRSSNSWSSNLAGIFKPTSVAWGQQ